MKYSSWCGRWHKLCFTLLSLLVDTTFSFRTCYFKLQLPRRQDRSLAQCVGVSRGLASTADIKIRRKTSTVLFMANPTDDIELLDTGFSTAPLLVIVALGLGFAAQGWINQQLQGDQGLVAFLRDGQGYKKSGFRPLVDGDRAASGDPLPWLSLPKLDFVEVAGQETASSQEEALMAELETLRLSMNQQLEQGNMAEANAIRVKLESRMRENGIEFQADES